jgi:hypothetical protein
LSPSIAGFGPQSNSGRMDILPMDNQKVCSRTVTNRHAVTVRHAKTRCDPQKLRRAGIGPCNKCDKKPSRILLILKADGVFGSHSLCPSASLHFKSLSGNLRLPISQQEGLSESIRHSLRRGRPATTQRSFAEDDRRAACEIRQGRTQPSKFREPSVPGAVGAGACRMAAKASEGREVRSNFDPSEEWKFRRLLGVSDHQRSHLDV